MFLWTRPCGGLRSPGFSHRTQRTERFTSPLPSWGPQAAGWPGQGPVVAAVRQGGEPRSHVRRQQEGGSLRLLLRPGLRFYELQKEAKFPQPPNETKNRLIGNRQGGRGGHSSGPAALGPVLGWKSHVCGPRGGALRNAACVLVAAWAPSGHACACVCGVFLLSRSARAPWSRLLRLAIHAPNPTSPGSHPGRAQADAGAETQSRKHTHSVCGEGPDERPTTSKDLTP